MSTLADLRPGDVGFSNITGYAGALIWAAQRVLAATEKSEAKIKHVFVVTQAEGTGRPYRDPVKIVQAMPRGAEEIEIGDEHWTKDFVYLRPMLDNSQGVEIATAARSYIGTPYSFADYAAILGLHMGIDNGAVRRYVTSSGHQICSQLADQSLSDAGFHAFKGKLPQDVMPIELYRALAAMPGTKRLVPGVTEGFSRPGEW
jgi:hypothetical protein